MCPSVCAGESDTRELRRDLMNRIDVFSVRSGKIEPIEQTLLDRAYFNLPHPAAQAHGAGLNILTVTNRLPVQEVKFSSNLFKTF